MAFTQNQCQASQFIAKELTEDNVELTDHVYSAAAASLLVTASGSSSVMSKKVKARKLTADTCRNLLYDRDGDPPKPSVTLSPSKRPIIHVYKRRCGKHCGESARSVTVKTEECEIEEEDDCNSERKKRRKIIASGESAKLGQNLQGFDGKRLRDSTKDKLCKNVENSISRNDNDRTKKRKIVDSVLNYGDRALLGSATTKKWVRLRFDNVDPKTFIGLPCKTFWPLDADWYSGRVIGYCSETNRHRVEYEDGDAENLILSNEKVKFYVSWEEMDRLKLSCCTGKMDSELCGYDEMVVMAAGFDDCQKLEPGNIIWAKLTGHAMWPAIVVEESLIFNRKGLKSVPVQFFGTHDFARIKTQHVVSFLKGLLSSFHLKCKKPRFTQGLEEAKMYLSEQKLLERMMEVQKKIGGSDTCDGSSSEDEGTPQHPDLPGGFSPVHVDCKDLDKCSVCHTDEEYVNNLFLQCDKCRMMVHARCYGELEPVDGVLWLCNLCRPGAPDPLPPCCLCPVIGGAMKPTNDGCWAHLACAIWIPETCFLDVKRMEPIDGINRINKDRWKLLCSICKVSYGACIQCSNNTCLVAYHPLCARAAGLCAELEDEGKTNLLPVDDDKDLCVRFLSFCKKHKQPSNDQSASEERIVQTTQICSDYAPPSNPSGCARTEPYNYFGRRGLKEPEALAAVSRKRLFVENQPYFVGGYRQHELSGSTVPSNRVVSLQKLKASQIDSPNNIVSKAEKYKHMKETFRKRLAFGKSRIHGFGIFAKHPHRAGDMVIEYTGELVRAPIADRRERFIYNSLVGAGTYMFRIDDERVIDATRAGSIAHLINHSCEPNCYSRGISVNGDEHIIIFAKRDIKQWEELTYDYRFFSIDEQLACYCGFPRCRGVVNDKEAEEQGAQLHTPRSALIDWTGV